MAFLNTRICCPYGHVTTFRYIIFWTQLCILCMICKGCFWVFALLSSLSVTYWCKMQTTRPVISWSTPRAHFISFQSSVCARVSLSRFLVFLQSNHEIPREISGHYCFLVVFSLEWVKILPPARPLGPARPPLRPSGNGGQLLSLLAEEVWRQLVWVPPCTAVPLAFTLDTCWKS